VGNRRPPEGFGDEQSLISGLNNSKSNKEAVDPIEQLNCEMVVNFCSNFEEQIENNDHNWLLEVGRRRSGEGGD
jgi:hypothetical protein